MTYLKTIWQDNSTVVDAEKLRKANFYFYHIGLLK